FGTLVSPRTAPIRRGPSRTRSESPKPPHPAMTPVPLRAAPAPADAQGAHRGRVRSYSPGRSEAMHGMIRALGRLLVMGLVMTAVLVAAVFAGVGPTTAVALGIVLAGIVGLIGVGRRPRPAAPVEQVAAMEATFAAAAATKQMEESTAVDAMAPPLTSRGVDPEANVPRWRRQSLLEARRADPALRTAAYRLSMRFTDDRAGSPDVRVVRYAVVPLLDRPDEVLGLRLSDLESGDEVLAVGATGAFVEVSCPNGEHGWVHRTTLGVRLAPGAPNRARAGAPPEADGALTAPLRARGLVSRRRPAAARPGPRSTP